MGSRWGGKRQRAKYYLSKGQDVFKRSLDRNVRNYAVSLENIFHLSLLPPCRFKIVLFSGRNSRFSFELLASDGSWCQVRGFHVYNVKVNLIQFTCSSKSLEVESDLNSLLLLFSLCFFPGNDATSETHSKAIQLSFVVFASKVGTRKLFCLLSCRGKTFPSLLDSILCFFFARLLERIAKLTAWRSKVLCKIIE